MTAFSVRNNNGQHLSNSHCTQDSVLNAVHELLYLYLIAILGDSYIIISVL